MDGDSRKKKIQNDYQWSTEVLNRLLENEDEAAHQTN